MNIDKIKDMCVVRAHIMMQHNMTSDMEFFDLIDLLVAIEIEKHSKQQILDDQICFNDEIVDIEFLGDLETMDISVTGDQLFYCNDVLTKNSMGIVFTADFVLALISSEELEEMGQLMIKQLKNRWGDLGYYRRFVIGIDRGKMKLFNLEESAQKNVMNNESNKAKSSDDESTFDKSNFYQKKKSYETANLT